MKRTPRHSQARDFAILAAFIIAAASLLGVLILGAWDHCHP